MNEFIQGYSNRIKPVTVPNKENKNIHMTFKGYSVTEEEYQKGVREGTPINRDLTWLDILYQCACEATEDKMVLITRYPVEFAACYSNIAVNNYS